MQALYNRINPKVATASESVAVPDPTMSHNTQPPATQNGCLFLTKLPPELRDLIYDYVAVAETNIGLQVNVQEGSKPQVDAYSVNGLGHTCKEIRQGYSPRLRRRIKHLLSETCRRRCEYARAPYIYAFFHGVLCKDARCDGTVLEPAMHSSAISHVTRVADRKLSKDVYIQEDVAYTMRIPFTGVESDGFWNCLTLTFSTDTTRAYNNRHTVDTGVVTWLQPAYWNQALWILIELMRSADWTGGEHWLALWYQYGMCFPGMQACEVEAYKVDGDILKSWLARLGCSMFE